MASRNRYDKASNKSRRNYWVFGEPRKAVPYIRGASQAPVTRELYAQRGTPDGQGSFYLLQWNRWKREIKKRHNEHNQWSTRNYWCENSCISQSMENSLERLDKNIDVLSPTFFIKPEICLTSSGWKCERCQLLQAPDFYSAGIRQRLWQQHERVSETSNKVVGLLLHSC